LDLAISKGRNRQRHNREYLKRDKLVPCSKANRKQPAFKRKVQKFVSVEEQLTLAELDLTDIVCVIKDVYGAFVYWNKALHHWFPEPSGGMYGKTEYHIMRDADAAQIRTNDRHVIATGNDLSAIEYVEMHNKIRQPWLVEKFRLKGRHDYFLGVFGHPIILGDFDDFDAASTATAIRLSTCKKDFLVLLEEFALSL